MKKSVLMLLTGTLLVGSCSEKKQLPAVQPVKVTTLTVGLQPVDGARAYAATIEEESGTALSFSAVGTVQSLPVSEGQFVKRGQLIGTLDATTAQNAYDAALATKEQALDAQRRLQQLHDNGSLPEMKWVEVQTQVRQALASEEIARKALADTRLYAPFSGYVAQRQTEVGANVAPGVPVVRLVNINKVKVKFSVPEEEMGAIGQGQRVSITIEALAHCQLTGVVVERGVTADALSRSYEVKALADNPQHQLLPGMIGTVLLDANQPDGEAAAIVLPAHIIQIDADNQPFVWTVADGKAVKTAVTLGDNVPSGVVIAGGLKSGDHVIVAGQHKVSSGMNVEE